MTSCLKLGLEVELAKSNISIKNTPIYQIWVICHLLPFVKVGQIAPSHDCIHSFYNVQCGTCNPVSSCISKCSCVPIEHLLHLCLLYAEFSGRESTPGSFYSISHKPTDEILYSWNAMSPQVYIARIIFSGTCNICARNCVALVSYT